VTEIDTGHPRAHCWNDGALYGTAGLVLYFRRNLWTAKLNRDGSDAAFIVSQPAVGSVVEGIEGALTDDWRSVPIEQGWSGYSMLASTPIPITGLLRWRRGVLWLHCLWG
jgi:hypothetical protein